MNIHALFDITVNVYSCIVITFIYANTVRKKFFRKNFRTVRVVKHLNRLPREKADGSSLSVFKRQLNNNLINML